MILCVSFLHDRVRCDACVCCCCLSISHGRLGSMEMKTILVPTLLELGPLPVRQVSAGGAHSVALMHSSRAILSPLVTPLPNPLEIPLHAL